MRVQLRREGKIDGQYTTALYRGQLADAALCLLHHRSPDNWQSDVSGCVEAAEIEVMQQADAEGRPLTSSVQENVESIREEVEKHVLAYAEKQAEHFANCSLVGTQVPMNLVLDLHVGKPVEFASHIDLLYRDPWGNLVIRDWKWRQEAPTMAYLGRNFQFALYWLACAYGEVLLDQGGVAERWDTLGEFAECEWCDLARFKPYTRKTKVTLPDGTESEYQKGDMRPLPQLIKRWTFEPDQEAHVKRMLAHKVTAIQSGLKIMNPGPMECHLCECSRYCPSFNYGDRHAE
jgi:hypothetical protein